MGAPSPTFLGPSAHLYLPLKPEMPAPNWCWEQQLHPEIPVWAVGCLLSCMPGVAFILSGTWVRSSCRVTTIPTDQLREPSQGTRAL